MERTQRQARFAPLGPGGQARLEAAHVTIVGVGALGSVAAELLARAGVRRLRLVDRDLVEPGNLHRVALFDERDAERALPKAPAAADHLRALFSGLAIEPVVADLDGARALELLEGTDLVLDGTDNFEARHVLNEAALASGTPWVHAACLGARAVAWPLVPGRGACYACLVPDVPGPGEVATCETAGVLGPAVHAAAAQQVTEAFKILAGRLEDLLPGPWTVDLWSGERALVRAVPREGCEACAGRTRFLGQRREGDWVACGREAVQLRPAALADGVDLEQLAVRLAAGRAIRQNRFLLRFTVEEYEVTVFADGRVLVSGTRDIDRARSLLARHLGG